MSHTLSGTLQYYKLAMTVVEHMMVLSLLCTVLLLQANQVSSVAPDDQQSQCLDTSSNMSLGHVLVNATTETQKPLLDSYWYVSLFGTGAVWKSIGGNSGNTGVSV